MLRNGFGYYMTNSIEIQQLFLVVPHRIELYSDANRASALPIDDGTIVLLGGHSRNQTDHTGIANRRRHLGTCVPIISSVSWIRTNLFLINSQARLA